MKIDRNDDTTRPQLKTRSQYVRQTLEQNRNSPHLAREQISNQIRPRNPKRLASDIQASKS